MSVSYQFSEVVQRDHAKIECPKCGKSRTLTVSRTYYRNGFHNESETREKNRASIRAEIDNLKQSGKICAACEAAERGDPITKKVGENLYDVFERSNPSVTIGQIERRRWSPKWVLVGFNESLTSAWNGGPARTETWPIAKDTLAEAAKELVKRTQLSPASEDGLSRSLPTLRTNKQDTALF